MRLSLRAQIFLSVLLAGVVPAFVLGLNDQSVIRTALDEQVERETRVAARSAAAQIRLLVEEKLRLMELLVAQTERADSGTEVERLLLEANETVPGMTAIVAMDSRGDVIATTSRSNQDGSPATANNYADRAYFRDLAAGADRAVTGYLESRTTGVPGIGVAVARRSPTGEFQGAIAGAVRLDQIVAELSKISGSVEALSLDVIDEGGRWIASTRTQASGEPIDLEIFQASDAEIATRAGMGPDEEPVDAAVVQLDSLIEWHVVAHRPERYAANKLWATFNVLVLVVAVVIALAILLSVFITSTVVAPIRQAVDTIDALERGDLTRSASATSPWYPTEIATLLETSARATNRLRGLVEDVRSTSEIVSHVSNRLDTTSSRLRATSEETAGNVESGLTLLETLATASERIREAVKTLTENTTGTAESATMLEGAAKSIVDNMDTLSNAIETVVGAVRQMEGEVAGLSNSIVTTNKSVDRVNFSLAALSHGVTAVQSATHESAELTKKTTRDAENGRDASEETIRAMNAITASFGRLSDSISSLANRSEAIDRVVEVIDDVTRATNLLAFNASIIAAQAGEHGAGFAVVAERVKSLADSTRQSTREIGDLIVDVREEIARAAGELSDSARLIHDGETLSLKAAESLGVIIDSSEDADAMVSRITDATEQQGRRLKDLQQSVEELRAVNERLEQSAGEQRRALKFISSSVLNARDINERVSATARAQAAETMSIASSTQVVDSRSRSIRQDVDAQGEATQSLQAAMAAFAQSAEQGAERSIGLDRAVRELGEHLKALERSLDYFRS